jgi:hypothetical protein
MIEITSARAIADAMTNIVAGFIVTFAPKKREGAMLGSVRVFQNACTIQGLSIDAGDLAYFDKVIAAKVAELAKGK